MHPVKLPTTALQIGSLAPSRAPVAWVLKYHFPLLREHPFGVLSYFTLSTSAASTSSTVFALLHSLIEPKMVSALHALDALWTTYAPVVYMVDRTVTRLCWCMRIHGTITVKSHIPHLTKFLVVRPNTFWNSIGQERGRFIIPMLLSNRIAEL